MREREREREEGLDKHNTSKERERMGEKHLDRCLLVSIDIYYKLPMSSFIIVHTTQLKAFDLITHSFIIYNNIP